MSICSGKSLRRLAPHLRTWLNTSRRALGSKRSTPVSKSASPELMVEHSQAMLRPGIYDGTEINHRDHTPQPTQPLWLGLEIEPREFKLFTKSHIKNIINERAPHIDYRPVEAASTVLPMRANNYVVEDLIEWDKTPDDPMYQLVFPQPGMLDPEQLNSVLKLMDMDLSKMEMRAAVEKIRNTMNPHPAGQKQLNVPRMRFSQEDKAPEAVPGMQHKYRETVLFFPTEAQYCHSYCTYCFRWAQFTAVGSSQQFASKDIPLLHKYLANHKDVSDLLFTGGDPMVMKAEQWERYLAPLMVGYEPNPMANEEDRVDLSHIGTVRIGTKSLAYWPYRYVTDPDANRLLRCLERVVASGRHVSVMAHFSNPVELSTPVVQEAIRRIRNTGAQIRTQAPLINHVNADPETWAKMWRIQTRLGCVPYYMFVERDTGARHYFEVPLARAYEIYTKAVSAVSGVSRTVRGPSMSTGPGKVHILGVTEVAGEKVYMLKFLQARNPDWSMQPFFAKYDPSATWLDDMVPAFGDKKWFWEDEYNNVIPKVDQSSGQMYPFADGMKYEGINIYTPENYNVNDDRFNNGGYGLEQHGEQR